MRLHKTRRPFEVLIGLALIALGLTTMIGWLVRSPAMFEIVRGMVPMVFNAGLCFFLAGALLATSEATGRRSTFLRQCVAVFMILISAAALLEHLFDTNYGVDLERLHLWYDAGNMRAGRMAPNTAIGFILFGAVAFLSVRVRTRRQALAVVLLTFLLLAVGLTGIVGYLLAPELLFNWARSARMALHTAVGMILCALGLWAHWSNSPWYLSERVFREEGKIRALGAAISIMSTLTIGLAGFVLLQGNLEAALQSRLETVVFNRNLWFHAVFSREAANMRAVLAQSGLEQGGLALLAAPLAAGARERFAADASRLLALRYRGVMLIDAEQREVAAVGQIGAAPDIAAPIDGSGRVELAWDGELLLRLKVPLDSADGRRGYLLLDSALPNLRVPLFTLSRLGSSGEVAVCADRQARLRCFPNSKHGGVFEMAANADGTPLPMQLAVAGGHGIAHARSQQGHDVLAAYGPLAPGLGMVVKQDTAETYASIRNSLLLALPILASVSLLGAILLISQLNPLVAKMRASAQAAADAAAEMETIMAAAGDGIVLLDRAGRVTSINFAACRIFGYDSLDVIGKDVTLLIPYAEVDAQREGMSWQVQMDMGISGASVQGRRATGELFPLELSVNAVPFRRRKLFVAMLRDITVRKEMEARLSRLAQYDALTGLPNRALFMDRLASALSRAERNHSRLALMFLDLDGFKSINDTFGHEGGDLLLMQVAERLQATVRHADTVARLGGDEFTILLENLAAPDHDLDALAQKMVVAMQAPFIIDGQQAFVTASIGVVVHNGADGENTVADLLRHADNQMYAVKRSGKNAYSARQADEGDYLSM
jgi:diguanylate cyclase (GGDEF)-like protein/PAS domain S-box-containing protein